MTNGNQAKNIDPKIYIQNISVAFDEQIIQT